MAAHYDTEEALLQVLQSCSESEADFTDLEELVQSSSDNESPEGNNKSHYSQ